MAQQRIHVVLSSDIVADIDRRVGQRARSRFFEKAARLELTRLKQVEALEHSAGAWADEDHMELDEGAASYVSSLRAEDECSRNESES